MSVSGVAVTVDTAPVRSMLDAIVQRMSDMTPVMREIGEIVVTQSAEAFENGGLPGHPWKKSMRVKESGGQTLINKSILRDSINVRASKNKVHVGTNEVYAAAHQFGFTGDVSQNVKTHSRKISQAFGKPISPRNVTVKAHARKIKQNIPARPYLPDEAGLNWEEIESALMRYLL